MVADLTRGVLGFEDPKHPRFVLGTGRRRGFSRKSGSFLGEYVEGGVEGGYGDDGGGHQRYLPQMVQCLRGFPVIQVLGCWQ